MQNKRDSQVPDLFTHQHRVGIQRAVQPTSLTLHVRSFKFCFQPQQSNSFSSRAAFRPESWFFFLGGVFWLLQCFKCPHCDIFAAVLIHCEQLLFENKIVSQPNSPSVRPFVIKIHYQPTVVMCVVSDWVHQVQHTCTTMDAFNTSAAKTTRNV